MSFRRSPCTRCYSSFSALVLDITHQGVIVLSLDSKLDEIPPLLVRSYHSVWSCLVSSNLVPSRPIACHLIPPHPSTNTANGARNTQSAIRHPAYGIDRRHTADAAHLALPLSGPARLRRCEKGQCRLCPAQLYSCRSHHRAQACSWALG